MTEEAEEDAVGEVGDESLFSSSAEDMTTAGQS